ncbi:cobyrinate a,c-diamide synthase [Geminicoccus roseus]|uniref:cobyrinate a,c-diamide synthase n=1 Tax=Geminicoccus roseus TaxID=404900 RepID=UPI000A060062|nr:cobyrinate a,c-diamide synthase [Geminicoccus roseus]
MIAAPASGSGKTAITAAILRALVRRGQTVGAFKVGPDYIDPAFHAAASLRPCVNIDPWAMRVSTQTSILEQAGNEVDLLVGEGVMGLFDGAADGTGATADLAATLAVPVILVVDAKGMGASAAALIEGFRDHREDVVVAGVIFNRVGTDTHARLLREACEARFALPILGFLPDDEALRLPGRHLGLVQAREIAGIESRLDRASRLVERHLDLPRLIRLARFPVVSALTYKVAPLNPLGQRIAVAEDDAFAFVYPSTLMGWRARGVEILPFSPLADQAPDPGADAVYLPGGYPELHAGKLAAAQSFRRGLRAAASRGATIYGECGGYMALGETLVDRAGTAHAMAGLLPVVTSFAAPRLHLGYRRAVGRRSSPLGLPGAAWRAHEFHYAAELEARGPRLFGLTDARANILADAGCAIGRICGSFIHLVDRAE